VIDSAPLDRNRLRIYSDFDGTITQKDTLMFLAEHLGGGLQMVEAIGRLIREGKISLRDGIAAEMRSIRAPFAEAVRLLQANVALDPGFPRFAKWCVEQQVPLTVLSAGFKEIIDLFLPAEDYSELEVIANSVQPDETRGWQCAFRDETPFGHDKSKILREARKRKSYVAFIGDGLSDRPPARVADEVFAKHSLFEYCQAHGITCHEFKDFDEIRELLAARL